MSVGTAEKMANICDMTSESNASNIPIEFDTKAQVRIKVLQAIKRSQKVRRELQSLSSGLDESSEIIRLSESKEAAVNEVSAIQKQIIAMAENKPVQPNLTNEPDIKPSFFKSLGFKLRLFG